MSAGARDAVGRQRTLAEGLATAFLGAPVWDHPSLVQRAAVALGRRPRWLGPCVREVLETYPRPPLDAPRELAAVVLGTSRFPRRRIPRVAVWQPEATRMGRAPWPVTPLDDVAALAALLEEDVEHLLWLADPRGYQRRAPEGPLHHYRSIWVPRPGRAPRLLEAPLPRLKRAQRTVLRAVLDAVPPHPAAHGYVRGHSAVTHAAAHTRHRLVLTLDLQAFFASISAARVYGVFRSCGYPEAVAHLLTGLCTVATPLAVLRRAPAGPGLAALRRELATPHLPQGAPTSPALANLVAQGLDRRLTGLAARYGLAYTRYADDLCFSGRGLPRLLVAAIEDVARDEGFALQEAKTRLRGRSQRQLVTGVVVNEHTAPRRADYDALKALLHDARLHGWEVAGRRHPHPDLPAHVLGRISWVAELHPERGARLRAAFDEVQRAEAARAER